jgi:hypothetical protein
MNTKRLGIMLGLLVVIAGAAVTRLVNRTYPTDSMQAVRAGQGEFKPLVLKGQAKPNWYAYRLQNGLRVHVEKKGRRYEPRLGVYFNVDGAKVHVQERKGFLSAHTHARVPKYVLGKVKVFGAKYSIDQIPPDQYYKGPSRFAVRSRHKLDNVAISGFVEHNQQKLTEELGERANSRSYLLAFPKAFPDYPKGAQLVVRFKLDGQEQVEKFPVHELPDPKTLSRSLF